jgi:aquaporin Z
MATTPALPGRIGAEFLGTFWLVLGGCGTAVLAANGFDDHSPGGYTLVAALVTEVVLTGFFLYVILGATDGRAPAGFAPLAIGLALTLIHLISIPVTNTSVNPARSTGVAPFAGSWAMTQLWLFWLAPLVGAAIAGVTYAPITGERITTPVKGETRTSAT